MNRKVMLLLLAGAICFLGSIPALAQGEPMQYSTLEEYTEATGATITKFGEAPELRILVAAGELPPVEERLPEDFSVVVPLDDVGTYGGGLRLAYTGWGGVFARPVGSPLVTMTPDLSKYIPHVLKSYEISDDGMTYTFNLRKGLKWSDGAPMTADDILFYQEDYFGNKELRAVYPATYTRNEVPVEVKKIDDYTVQFIWVQPATDFLFYLGDGAFTPMPKHYLKNFHASYTGKDELDKLVAAEGLEDWTQLFTLKRKRGYLHNPDMPVLTAWKLTDASTDTRKVYERNPYFWKVDTAGNQLPYIDKVTMDLAGTAEMVVLKVVTGELDWEIEHARGPDYTLLMESREQGDYRVLRWSSPSVQPTLRPNITVNDPVLRELFNEPRFKYALSLALNREEVNELIAQGQGAVTQAATQKGLLYYDEEWENWYIEHDVERANALLDEIGLTPWDDQQEYRLRSDGDRLTITCDVSAESTYDIDVLELVTTYWKDIGIELFIKSSERSLHYNRLDTNQHEMAINHADPMQIPYIARPYQWTTWATDYAKWYYTRGESGEKPPVGGDIERLWELYDAYNIATPEQMDAIALEMQDIHKKNMYSIGLIGSLPRLGIAKNDLGNVPDGLVYYYAVAGPRIALAEQWYWKK